MKKSKRIIFFGNERLATGVTTSLPIFTGLIETGFEISALVISQDGYGKDKKIKEPEIIKVARQNAIRIINPDKMSGIIEEIKSLQVEVAVLVAFGKIIPKSILDLFPIGIINVHPSLLPLHRGPTPIESVIRLGELKTGVSVMKLASGMDSGPLYRQKEIIINGDESKQVLTDKLNNIGRDMIISDLQDIIEGNLLASPQPDQGVTYDRLLTKKDGEIDWNIEAKQIERNIRAFSGWPRSRTTINNLGITITEAHLGTINGKPGHISISAGEINVCALNGSIVIDKIIPNGKNEMSGSSFLLGYKDRLLN